MVGVVCCALATWTCAYGSIAAPEPATADEGAVEPEPIGEPASAEPPTMADGSEVTPAEPEPPPLAGPRLRHAPEPGQLGLPLGLEDVDGRSLERFHAALARAGAGQGQARILFYGASHVASDSFTGWIREQLQLRFGDAGHGFVLPVHPWRSYVHSGVRIESNRERWSTLRIRDGHNEVDRYGLAGVAVESTRADAWGAVATAARGEVGTRASRFEIFYLKQPGGGDFDVIVDNRYRERVRTRAGAVEPGYAVYEVPDGPHSLKIRTRGNGRVRVFGVAVERDRPGVVLDTLGINGSRARFHLKWEDALYREHLARRRPDLVVLAYGTNESGDTLPMEDYEQELREVIGRVQETVPEASCLLIGPSDRPVLDEATDAWVDRPRTAEINEVQRRVSRELGCAYFDLVAFTGGPLSMVEWVEHDPPHGARDHIHFTRHGYQRLAEELHAALLERFPEPAAQPTEPPAAVQPAPPTEDGAVEESGGDPPELRAAP